MEKFRPKILLVDDETEAREGLARTLRHKGYEVVEVGSGGACLARAKAEWPALIVLDVVLPDLPGTEVYKKLKSDPVTRAIPILMLTAKPDVVETLQIEQGGPDRTYEKPGRVENLVEVIRGMVSGRGNQ